MDLKKRFFAYHNEKKTFVGGEKVLVAFSGGKDSLCLLHLLKECAEEWKLKIGACHVHHMIRGEEADQELAFCRKAAEALSVPFFAKKVNVPAFCKENGVGIEEGARLERYRLLEETAKEEGYGLIATAHSASDQAETVLFRLIRGSGIAGTKGIPEQRGVFIRPLLPFYQEEILDFLEENQMIFTKDSSNFDTIYARNRLRSVILPEMKRVNPSVEKSLVRFGTLSSWHDALCRSLCDKIEESETIDPSSGSIPISILEKYACKESDFPLLYELLSRMTKRENISIDFERFLSLLTLLKSPNEGKIIEISNGFSFIVKKNELHFQKHESFDSCIEYEVKLKEGNNFLSSISEILHVSEKKKGKVININKKSLIIHLSSDTIKGELVARNFRDGDKIRINGMTKRIKKMFCDAGIPKKLRSQIPLITDDEEILWIPFFGLCDKVRNEDTNMIRTLTLSGEALKPIQQMMNHDSQS